MTNLTSLLRRVADGLMRLSAFLLVSLKSGLGRFFYTRPALKRFALVVGLHSVVLVPLVLLETFGGPGLLALWLVLAFLGWSLFLLGLFWGFGAERAATEWDDVFALPPLSSLAFWRWHALEKKRFCAVLAALGTGLVVAVFLGIPR